MDPYGVNSSNRALEQPLLAASDAPRYSGSGRMTADSAVQQPGCFSRIVSAVWSAIRDCLCSCGRVEEEPTGDLESRAARTLAAPQEREETGESKEREPTRRPVRTRDEQLVLRHPWVVTRLMLARSFPVSRDAGLTNAEATAIHLYTRGSIAPGLEAFRAMNQFLRGESLEADPQTVETTPALCREAARGLAKLPDYVGRVRRDATGLPASVLDQFQPGRTVTEPGFTSTTKLRPDHDYGVGHVTFFINSRHGKDVSSLSGHPQEAEVLFGPDTRFRVASRSDSDGKTVIVLDELDP